MCKVLPVYKLLCVKDPPCRAPRLCVKLLCVKAALFKTRANSSAFSVPLPPSTALPKLFSHLSVHADAELCRGYFPRFPRLSTLQSLPCCSLPPKAISHGFPSVHHVVAEVSLPPTGAAVSRLPPCRRFRVPCSQRSSPQAASHGFPSVHPVVAEASLPPNLFPTVSRPPCHR